MAKIKKTKKRRVVYANYDGIFKYEFWSRKPSNQNMKHVASPDFDGVYPKYHIDGACAPGVEDLIGARKPFQVLKITIEEIT